MDAPGSLNEGESGQGVRHFEDEWPGLRNSLNRVLASRGVPSHKRDDLLQETGLRLYRRWHAIDKSVPIIGLAVTIATNLMRDEFRRGRREVICEPPDEVSSIDVERAGLARIELDGVSQAMTKLSRDHRAALLLELSGNEALGERSRDAIKMLRFRARRRLAAIMQAASAWFLWPWLKLNRSVGQDQVVATSAAAVLVLASSLAIGQPDRALMNNSELADARSSISTSVVRSKLHRKTRHARPKLEVMGVSTSPSGDDAGGVREPMRAEVGGSSVEAEATVDAEWIRVEVRDTGGPVPVCVDGSPEPNPLACPMVQDGD